MLTYIPKIYLLPAVLACGAIALPADAGMFNDLRYTFSDGTTGGPLGGPDSGDLSATNVGFSDPANQGVSNSGNNVFVRGDVTDGTPTVADPGSSTGLAFTPVEFIEFTLNVDPGSLLELDEVRFDYFDEGSGGTDYQVSFTLRSSLDGFVSDLVSVENYDSNTPATAVADLDALGSTFEDLTGSVTFRVFTYGNNQFNGGSERSRLDNIFISGETTVIPEPSSALLLVMASVIGQRRRCC